MAHVSPFSSLCTSITGVAGCDLIAGQPVYRDQATEAYHGWQYGMDDVPRGMAMEYAQAGQAVQIMVEGVFHRSNIIVPSGNTNLFTIKRATTTLLGLPKAAPGSICEQCFDAPALVLRAAPWGGDMGVCLACLVGGRKENPYG